LDSQEALTRRAFYFFQTVKSTLKVLHHICSHFTFLLQSLPDTTPVIAEGQKPPIALPPPATAKVEIPQSTYLKSLIEPQSRPHIHAEAGRYRVRLAQTTAHRESACRLRFKVFNIELGEGLESSYDTGLDSDNLDVFCEHLLVENKEDGRIVGTYRMQTGLAAEANLGYYSEQEFNFAPYGPLRRDILELGRAAIDREHRTPEVLTLLWRGIAQCANEMGLRYLIGCSSLTSKDPGEGWRVYRQLKTEQGLSRVRNGAHSCLCLSHRARERRRPAVIRHTGFFAADQGS
jgi:Acetyltransferase (GNAT) domain